MRAREPAAAVRAAALSDLQALQAIEEEAFAGDRLDRRAFRHAVLSRTIVALVAADPDGSLAGYVLIQLRRGSTVARLTSIAVAKAASRRGIARALLSAAEAAAREAGGERMRLEVRADNAAARHLYETGGYRRFNTVAEYYEDGEAAWRFEKELA